MKTIIRYLAAMLLVASWNLASAHDFTITTEGQKIYFNIKSNADKTAEVTYGGSINDKKAAGTRGTIEIPAKVKHNNVIYTVTGIGAKAFSGASQLEGVVIPSTVKNIGSFAFEGCSSLSKIIFPGGEVRFGEGVFFKCVSIKDISFGSDWKTVDLSRFRWSDSLKAVILPAKVEKVMNLKSLKNLESVSVDVNNARFSSDNGVLYNKDGKVLYGCPRAFNGELKIKEGTETVTVKALIDCPEITAIVFPASIKSFSFRETSRMKQLETITFKGSEPVHTGFAGKDGKFLLQVANPKVKILVPNSAKKAFKTALVTERGEFAESDKNGSTPYSVEASQMPQKNNIVGVKNFSK